MWRAFRIAGVRLCSTWIDLPDNGIAGDVWRSRHDDVCIADRLILYAETGDLPLRGALVEVGIAMGRKIPIFVVAPGCWERLGSWTAHPSVRRAETLEQAVWMSVLTDDEGAAAAGNPIAAMNMVRRRLGWGNSQALEAVQDHLERGATSG